MINVNRSLSGKSTSDVEENVGTMLPQVGLGSKGSENNQYLNVTTDISDLGTFITECDEFLSELEDSSIYESSSKDIKKEYKFFKKEYSTHIKSSKKFIKSAEYDKAQKEIDACISLIIQIEKRLDKAESTQDLSDLLGYGILSAMAGIKSTVLSTIPFIGKSCGSYTAYKMLIFDIQKIRNDAADDIKTNLTETGEPDPTVLNKYKTKIKAKLAEFRKNLEKYKSCINEETIAKELTKTTNKSGVDTEKITKEILSTEKAEDRDGDGELEMSPEANRMDEIRGKVATLEDKLEKAKAKAEKSGNKEDENRVKGLTNQLEKAKKELKSGEKNYKDELEDLEEDKVEESSNDYLFNINQERIKNTQKFLKYRNEATSAGDKMLYESMILKEQDKYEKAKALYESTVNDMSIYTERANLDKEIADIVDTFNRKGYNVKYASAGHKELRKKSDVNHDGVYHGKLYSDARVMFDKKYNFDDTPKYWHWRDVDGCSYLDITPKNYYEDDGTPEKAFEDWKKQYLYSLRVFAKELKPLNGSSKEEKTTEEEIKEGYEFMDSILESMGFDSLTEDIKAYESAIPEQKSVVDELNDILK